jgi:hypothetical protein
MKQAANNSDAMASAIAPDLFLLLEWASGDPLSSTAARAGEYIPDPDANGSGGQKRKLLLTGMRL